MIKAHQSAAWAIWTATSASFFNHASLLWLKQLQDWLPPSDTRTHQDLNKIIASLEYSADATLNSTQFCGSVIDRRMSGANGSLPHPPTKLTPYLGHPWNPCSSKPGIDTRSCLLSQDEVILDTLLTYSPRPFRPLTPASISLATNGPFRPDLSRKILRSDRATGSLPNVPFGVAGAGPSIEPNDFASSTPIGERLVLFAG